jgi:hypothetical protein
LINHLSPAEVISKFTAKKFVQQLLEQTYMTDKVSQFLKELDDDVGFAHTSSGRSPDDGRFATTSWLCHDHRHTQIFKSMVFPDTLKMREKPEHAIVQTTYKCDEVCCDFSDSLITIQNDARLLKWKSKDTCLAVVTDIEKHHDDYLPHSMDGYFVNRMGHELVHLRRHGTNQQGVTGFIEYNDLRKDSMEFYNKQKNELFDTALRRTEKHASCSIL